MDTLSLVLLGIIAASSLAQAVALVGVVLAGRRIARRMGGLEESLERDLRPTLQQAARLARSVAEISEVTAVQARRAVIVLDSGATKVDRTGTLVSEALLPLAARAARVASVSRAVLAALRVFRRPRHR